MGNLLDWLRSHPITIDVRVAGVVRGLQIYIRVLLVQQEDCRILPQRESVRAVDAINFGYVVPREHRLFRRESGRI